MGTKKWECDALSNGNDIFLMHTGISPVSEAVYHDFTMIVYAAHGESIHCIEGKNIEFREGDVFVVNPGIIHSFSTTSKVPFPELYYCFLSPQLTDAVYEELKNEFPELAHFFDNTFTHYLYTQDNLNKEIRGLFVRMIDEFMNCPPGNKCLVKSYLTIMLAKIFRRCLHSINNPVFNRNKNVDQVIRYINYNLNYGVQLRDIANAFHLSEEYLCRLFKKHTGTTIKQFIINLRIEKVKDLLQNTDRSIESMAVSLNCNQLYLNRLFKKHTGMTLLEYRKQYHYKA